MAAGADVLYLRNLLERLGLAQRDPAQVFEDNTDCMEWDNNIHECLPLRVVQALPEDIRELERRGDWDNNVIGGRERAKHIDIRKHFAYEVIQNGKMRLVQVATAFQLADIFRKGLHYPQWKACVEGILGKTIALTC